MFFKILFYLFILAGLLSCSVKNSRSESEPEEESTFSLYENEYYSFIYPEGWKVVEHIRDKAEGYEKYEGDEKMTLRQHEVELINDEGILFSVVLSNVHSGLPVKDYADSSILFKGLAPAGECQEIIDSLRQNDHNEYLGYWRKDSVIFSDHEAVLLKFGVVTPANDTLIQKQIVVQNDKGDTFYVNSTFHSRDKIAEARGDIVLETFRLK